MVWYNSHIELGGGGGPAGTLYSKPQPFRTRLRRRPHRCRHRRLSRQPHSHLPLAACTYPPHHLQTGLSLSSTRWDLLLILACQLSSIIIFTGGSPPSCSSGGAAVWGGGLGMGLGACVFARVDCESPCVCCGSLLFGCFFRNNGGTVDTSIAGICLHEFAAVLLCC